MTLSLRTLLPLVFAPLLSTAVLAQATINDCEKIQAADAYNQCLAKFGPPAKGGNLEPERPGDVKSGPEAAAQGAGAAKGARRGGRHRGRGYAVRRGRHGGGSARGHRGGRKRMSISVGK